MKPLPLMFSFALGVMLAGATGTSDARVRNVTDPDAPRSLPTGDSTVSVDWTDPSEFTELRFSGNRWEAQRGNWVQDLAQHLRTSAQRQLQPGQQLDVTITDIQRAGSFEPQRPVHMDNVRILRDIYPPRVTLNFKLTDSSGNVVSEGERRLVNPGYLSSSSIGDSDPLRHEKRLLDDWTRREFAQARANHTD